MLWIQCMEMISLVREFVKAERTGNWPMHRSSQAKMLPYFAASGHDNYTKGSYMYLQSRSKLEQNNPKVYQKFLAGYHVVRRSNRYWAGLSTDLMIEQTLMRSMKSVGGITRGRSMTEEQRAVWLLSMPDCSATNEALQNFTRVKYVSSEQHKDATPSRIKRDMEDTTKLLELIHIHDPFTKEEKLHSISSGIMAASSANTHDVKTVGEIILRKMIGNTVSGYTFRKADQVKTLASKSVI